MLNVVKINNNIDDKLSEIKKIADKNFYTTSGDKK